MSTKNPDGNGTIQSIIQIFEKEANKKVRHYVEHSLEHFYLHPLHLVGYCFMHKISP